MTRKDECAKLGHDFRRRSKTVVSEDGWTNKRVYWSECTFCEQTPEEARDYERESS